MFKKHKLGNQNVENVICFTKIGRVSNRTRSKLQSKSRILERVNDFPALHENHRVQEKQHSAVYVTK